MFKSFQVFFLPYLCYDVIYLFSLMINKLVQGFAVLPPSYFVVKTLVPLIVIAKYETVGVNV